MFSQIFIRKPPRKKPGPKPKKNPRSEKITFRVTKKQKRVGQRYCRRQRIVEAKLVRMIYLAATGQSSTEHYGQRT
jgi:hypothetical protein